MSTSKKLVTAIVVVYNGEKYLKDCLQSIVEQDYQPLEIIVVDDGSTDSTPNIIKSFGERIKYVYQKNAGEASARNTGVKLAQGDYIAFLDADDLWCPDKISTQVKVFEKFPEYSVVYGDFHSIGEAFQYGDFQSIGLNRMRPEIDKKWSGWLYPRMLLDSWVHIITAMTKKDVFADIGAFNIDNIIGTDYDFWIRVSKKYQMAKIPYPLALYRSNPTSATAKFVKRNYGAELVQKYMREYGTSDPLGGSVTAHQIRKRLHQQWFMHGYIARNNGKHPAAAQSFAKAARYAPFNHRIYMNMLFSIFKTMENYVKSKE